MIQESLNLSHLPSPDEGLVLIENGEIKLASLAAQEKSAHTNGIPFSFSAYSEPIHLKTSFNPIGYVRIK